MSIAITAGSTIDLTPELREKFDIKIAHFYLEKDGHAMPDDAMPVQDMFAYTEKTGQMCHTSAPSVGDIETLFEEELKTHEGIIHFSMSSGLSACHANAVLAAKGNPNIKCVDVHGTSGTIALLAMWARKLIDAGYPLEEVYRSCVERNQSAQCSFIISELNYLYRGGRCGKLALLGANLLKLRPVIVTGKDGKFATGKKFRGPIRKCILSYVDDLLHSYSNFDYSCAYINYSWLEDPSVIQDVIAKAKEAGFKEVIETQASPTNGYHAGPNVLGFQFLYDGEHTVKPYKE